MAFSRWRIRCRRPFRYCRHNDDGAGLAHCADPQRVVVVVHFGYRSRHPADVGQPVAAADGHRLELGTRSLRNCGGAARWRTRWTMGPAAQGPGTPARYRIGGGMAVATVGFTTPHFRRHAAAHRSTTYRTGPAAAQHTAVDRGRDAYRGGTVPSRC